MAPIFAPIFSIYFPSHFRKDLPGHYQEVREPVKQSFSSFPLRRRPTFGRLISNAPIRWHMLHGSSRNTSSLDEQRKSEDDDLIRATFRKRPQQPSFTDRRAAVVMSPAWRLWPIFYVEKEVTFSRFIINLLLSSQGCFFPTCTVVQNGVKYVIILIFFDESA